MGEAQSKAVGLLPGEVDCELGEDGFVACMSSSPETRRCDGQSSSPGSLGESLGLPKVLQVAAHESLKARIMRATPRNTTLNAQPHVNIL